jgi:hypothetical protein
MEYYISRVGDCMGKGRSSVPEQGLNEGAMGGDLPVAMIGAE